MSDKKERQAEPIENLTPTEFFHYFGDVPVNQLTLTTEQLYQFFANRVEAEVESCYNEITQTGEQINAKIHVQEQSKEEV